MQKGNIDCLSSIEKAGSRKQKTPAFRPGSLLSIRRACGFFVT
ncbi:hypothetical protein C4K25_2046 [Pseudomonas chlororaphis]|nr:hypothetical protein C4K25_2046 [Pseudomonas chlororaphis]